MAALTTIEGDVWQDETCVPENLGWPGPSFYMFVCMHVGILMGEEILPAHWAVKGWTHLGH